MLKFQCNSCGETKELMKATIKIIDGKVRTVEALCECGEYMQEIAKEFNGFRRASKIEFKWSAAQGQPGDSREFDA